MATNKEIEQKYYIDTSLLSIGQEFKNIKSMCLYLNQEYNPKGGSKKAQINEWKRYIDYIKDGQKIIITKIYDIPLKQNDNRKNNGLQSYPDWSVYQVPKKDYKSNGVYAIILNNNIYIGSTTNGFLSRYRQHANSNNPLYTLDMLNNGAVFKSLWVANVNCSEETIRQKESEYIYKYINDKRWNVVNARQQTSCYSQSGILFLNGKKVKSVNKHNIPKKPNDIRYIKIRHQHYDEAISLLTERGLL